MSVSAACDQRFKAIKEEDLKNMELEISVLTPLKQIKSVNEIELGKHGIYIKKGLNTGTFFTSGCYKNRLEIRRIFRPVFPRQSRNWLGRLEKC